MVVGKTFFKKDSEKLITFKSGGNPSMIDYVVVNKKFMKRVRDVKVIPGEECFSQHKLLVVDLAWESNSVVITLWYIYKRSNTRQQGGGKIW